MSVINQVLKDLDGRETKPGFSFGLGFSRTIPSSSIFEDKIPQHLIWGVFLVSVVFCSIFIWRNSTLNVDFKQTDYFPVISSALKNDNNKITEPIVGSELVTEIIEKQSMVTEIAWRSYANGAIELLLTLEKQSDFAIVTKKLNDGEQEITLAGVDLNADVPPISQSNKLIDFYQLGERQGDLVLRLKPFEGVHVSSEFRSDNVWVIRAEPVFKPKLVQAPSSKSNFVKQKKMPIVNTQPYDIKKPVIALLTAEGQYQQALVLLNSNRVSVAILKLQKALQIKPAAHNARELLANLYLQVGRETEAYILLDQGINIDNEYMPFVRLYAQSLIQRGRLQQAKKTLLAASSASNLDADYYALLAALTQRSSEHQESISYYMRALELNPKNSQWWMGLAISLETLGQVVAAIGAYNEAKTTGNLNAELLSYIDSRLTVLEVL